MTKPVILTVDDDTEVLAAIERDLRAKYAGDFRVLKASTGRSALDAVRELKKRGAPVALFLVDQRMPGMTGVELLRELGPLYPEAKKVLLTAYADTEAAIASINDVGLDHYLMKPWAPPATRLYPVLDDLLAEWTASVRLPFEGIRVIGSPWSRASYTAKEFLSRNHVPYQWTDIDQDDAAREMVRQAAGGTSQLPVIFFPDGSHLVAPTTLELAAKAGLRTQAERPFYDLIIIGGGPAGLANAVYAGSEGLRTVLIEASAPGGQAGTSSRIENYLGFPNGITGADLAQRAVAQARRFGTEILTAREVVGIRRADPYRFVKLADGTELSSYAVVISTGMQVRRLAVPGVDELTGAGVYYGAAMTEGATYRGRDVCIVGAANSAGQGAMFFSRTARKVTLLVHGTGIEKKMSDYLVARIKATDNIEVISGVDVVRVEGKDHLERVILRDAAGAERALAQAAMFIFVGATPRTEMFEGTIARDEAGFILTGPDLPRKNGKVAGWPLERDPFLFETSIPGVFAAGDVRAGANRRVAAAVGEGSAAIYTVHRYLETV